MNNNWKTSLALSRKAMRGLAATTALGLAAGFASPALADPAHYYDGAAQRKISPEPSLFAEFAPPPGQGASRAADGAAPWNFVTLHNAGTRASVGRNASTSPVFHEGDSPAGRLMALPGGVIINFKPDWSDTQIMAWLAAKSYTLKQRLALSGNWYVIQSPPGQASLDLANAIYASGEVLGATPNWWKETVTR